MGSRPIVLTYPKLWFCKCGVRNDWKMRIFGANSECCVVVGGGRMRGLGQEYLQGIYSCV